MKIILITAVWCTSCLIMKPRYQELAKKHNITDFIELDFDMDEEDVESLNIGNTLPVCIMIKEEKEVKRVIGEKKVKDIEKIFEDLSHE
ncbi:MAG: thioredoxin family protein [Bacilli bacterium]|nr:thioredoxin family protein [Bacilli bacterium]MDD3349021.1 thioredoxin family protein [Bacilli bacterium]MDD4056968.1 thioredoxin family protein [Bacilli bacterium]MDY0209294.1 thioredoxin family protein [Bacilli bacterium]